MTLGCGNGHATSGEYAVPQTVHDSAPGRCPLFFFAHCTLPGLRLPQESPTEAEATAPAASNRAARSNRSAAMAHFALLQRGTVNGCKSGDHAWNTLDQL